MISSIEKYSIERWNSSFCRCEICDRFLTSKTITVKTYECSNCNYLLSNNGGYATIYFKVGNKELVVYRESCVLYSNDYNRLKSFRFNFSKIDMKKLKNLVDFYGVIA
jgi:ribosomal protein L37AE/L43A